VKKTGNKHETIDVRRRRRRSSLLFKLQKNNRLRIAENSNKNLNCCRQRNFY